MGKYISLRPIARFDKSVVSYIENNFRTISAAFASLTASEVGAALSGHTHAIVLDSFVAPTFVNGWANFAGHHTVAYYKDLHSRVHLRGSMSGGTMNLAAFTLPVGYRPLATLFMTPGAGQQIDILSNGDVKPTVGASGDIYGLNFSFRAEQ